MGGRRFAQRGHASLTTELLRPVASHAQGMVQRKHLFTVAAVIAVGVFVAASLLYGPTSRHDSLAEPSARTPTHSLLDSAVSRVQEAVRVVVPPASGPCTLR
eukprot:TRINITY_DN31864_c0_g1_i1.p2 TRINITY_DN31864_c0_g1~~TRINITY_DN31864_c0_g1_i1.p2  ORF type:complete len:102 (-),score=5.47 TRINITY_DN31864_c0_g1_i1:4-309(-)